MGNSLKIRDTTTYLNVSTYILRFFKELSYHRFWQFLKDTTTFLPLISRCLWFRCKTSTQRRVEALDLASVLTKPFTGRESRQSLCRVTPHMLCTVEAADGQREGGPPPWGARPGPLWMLSLCLTQNWWESPSFLTSQCSEHPIFWWSILFP